MMSSSFILTLTTYGWFVCSLFYAVALLFKRNFVGKLAVVASVAVLFMHLLGMILRWKESYDLGIGHAPITNLYESLVFGSWSVMLVYLLFLRRWRIIELGVIPSLLAFLAMSYASFSPHVESRIQPLIPALKSNWLIAHVITCFLGYAAFAVSFGASVIYLAKTRYEDRGLFRAISDIRTLEKFNYQVIMFGFLWLTVGILTGAVWADSAWGSYWSWDPKETWSLITWLIYAAILHAHSIQSWSGRRIAILSVIGFGCVLFTYLGVNFLLSGLHSYGAR